MDKVQKVQVQKVLRVMPHGRPISNISHSDMNDDVSRQDWLTHMSNRPWRLGASKDETSGVLSSRTVQWLVDKKAGGSPSLPPPPLPPPPPPIVPPNVKPEKLDPHKRSITSRHGFGSTGRRISLLTNHFKVSVKHPDKIFYQYTVSICSEDNRAVESKVVDKLYKTYSSKLAGKGFAYDGEKSLYTVGPLPQNNFEFTVVLGESFAKRGSPHGGSLSESGKRSKRSFQSITFKVELSYAAKIPLKSISLVLQGSEPENIQDTLRALDIILRQQAANSFCDPNEGGYL
ncbi:hypothetical protein HYC85_014449 [Camellia sinensis]|uniref:Protein argonaute N-terminal domain-containing protein n=1 Tax=Camellia sinensis TaxID=4442 RepID=A0A7J7H682_CAMSI|nr:hypothetical protein HYC85_014449 [Camellia sinensis]